MTELKEKDIKVGTTLVCTKTENYSYYSVGDTYDVVSVDKEEVELTDNIGIHSWDIPVLLDKEWDTTFEIAVAGE